VSVELGPPRASGWSGGLRRETVPFAALVVAAAAAALFALPLVALVWRALGTDIWSALGAPAVRTALWLSLVCSLAATVVGGVALLYAFGRRGLFGQWLDHYLGLRLPFTTAGAVLAETFVAMPFFVLTVEGALRSMDGRLESAARTLGAGRWTVFHRVTLPLVRPSVVAGALLSWARALGEFGATITFAGNFPGRTQTLPLAVYLALESDPEAGVVLSLLLLVVSLAVLIALRHRLGRLP
jgi:molybdate transport system permease protein